MKKLTILIIFLLINCISLYAQENHKNILKLDPVNYYRKVAPPSLYQYRVQLQKPSTGNLTASFTPNVPQNVKDAINMAVEIWNWLLNFNTSVVAKFDWQVLGPDELGGSATVDPIFYNGKYYPVSLANVLIGSDQNGSNPEMDITFGSTFNWYLGLDGNPPTNTVDLVSVAFHEIGHGLGWDGTFYTYKDQQSGIVLGDWGIALGPEVYPMIFDTFIDDFAFDLLDTEEYPRNSPELGQALTSDHIFFNGNETQSVFEIGKLPLYCPTAWDGGSSVYHLRRGDFPVDNPPIMVPYLGYAESIHSPGDVVLASLIDIGWFVNRTITISVPQASVLWNVGSNYDIKWTDTHVGNVKIELVKSDGVSFQAEIEDQVLSEIGYNTYSWFMNFPIPSDVYRIKISDVSGNLALSEVFQIAASGYQQVAKPVINPNGGNFINQIDVTITCTPGAQIKYTTNGSEPTSSSQNYTGTINLTATTTIKAKGFKAGYINSLTSSATFIKGPVPINITTEQTYYYNGLNHSFGNVGIWKNNQWDFNTNSVNSNEEIFLQYGFDFAPEYYPPNKFKYHRNSTTPSNNLSYLNYDQYESYETTSDNIYWAFFEPVKNATVNINVDGISNLGKIDFADPWFYDLEHPLLGQRNRGTLAEFHANTVPFNPNTNTSGPGSEYKGVFLNQLIEPNKPYYSVRTPQTVDFGGSLGIRNVYFQNWGYDPLKISLASPNSNQTAVVFKTADASLTANLKAAGISNNPNAYSSNSQKKLVRTTDGYLHKVYESMGYVWYETSNDNGITWTVENNGKPLSSNESKLPAIDINSGSEIIIVWQEKNKDTYKIKLAHYQRPGTQLVFYDVFDETVYYPPVPYSYNTMPVIAWGNNKLLVAWKEQGGLSYKYGYADCYGPTTWYTGSSGTWITGTDDYSINPTIAIRKDGGTTVFHLAWQQGTSAIKYCSLTPDAQNNISISSIETASTGDGVNYKKNPSISIISTSPTIVWVRSIYEGATTQVSRRTRSSGVWGSFTIYGSNVESPTEYNSRVVWSENNVNKLYHPWKRIKTLSTIGKSVQLSTGNSMYAVAYRQFSPFDFQTSQDVETLPKINSLVNQCGRKGIIANGDAEFYFILADVIVDNEVIKFEEVKETTVPKNINELNSYLATNSFSLSEASSFSFSLACGAADTLKAANKLKGSLLVQFKVELVDANTNTILGELDNIIFNSSNIHSYRDKSYKVNTQGIGNRTVKLRVTEKTNFNGAYYLADIFND